MAGKQRNRKRIHLRKLIRTKFRMNIYNEKTFAEVFSLRLSLANVFLIVSVLSILLILIVYFVIAYTPLKEYIIPNYPELEEREKIVRNAQLVDSLETEMELYAQKMQILNTILNGEDPSEYENIDSVLDAARSESTVVASIDNTPADSLLRLEIEEYEALNVNFGASQTGKRIENFFFYPPVNGVVSSNFSKGHCGTDVVAAENSIIHSVLNGTVILDTWTVETGYTIIIQHSNDFISVYKHNAKLLKKAGDHVIAGEGIALLGNTGDLTLGPHLHFELWHEGKPVNSENYIVF